MTTSVKYFHCNMPGAPTLNDEPGALINVLDACLVDGFGLKSVDTLTVTANVATATVSSGVTGYEPDSVILVAGAGVAELNGEKRILSVTGTTITFAAPGVANGSSGGTITLKMAPLGWAKPFSGTNLAAYRSQDMLGTRMFLRVDDTPLHFSSARVRGYESLSDIDNGVKPFPTLLQLSEGNSVWGKAHDTSNTPRGWLIVGDGRTFYYLVNTVNTTTNWANGGVLSGFGDFISYRPGDALACMLQHGWDNESYVNSYRGNDWGDSSLLFTRTAWQNIPGFYAPRSFTGQGGSVNLGRRALGSMWNNEWTSGTGNFTGAYPNPADNSLHLCKFGVMESAPATTRGHLRGLYFCTQEVRAAFRHMNKIDGSGELGSRKLLAVRSDSRGWGDSNNGVGFIDITGPWE